MRAAVHRLTVSLPRPRSPATEAPLRYEPATSGGTENPRSRIRAAAADALPFIPRNDTMKAHPAFAGGAASPDPCPVCSPGRSRPLRSCPGPGTDRGQRSRFVGAGGGLDPRRPAAGKNEGGRAVFCRAGIVRSESVSSGSTNTEKRKGARRVISTLRELPVRKSFRAAVPWKRAVRQVADSPSASPRGGRYPRTRAPQQCSNWRVRFDMTFSIVFSSSVRSRSSSTKPSA